MKESRLHILPKQATNFEPMKVTLNDGKVIESSLEYSDTKVNLGSYTYLSFVGTTAGRKGEPNQDFAGLSKVNLHIEGKRYDCLLMMVADGVSSKSKSEITSKEIIQKTIDNFFNSKKEFASFKDLSFKLWKWITDAAQEASTKTGVSTVSAFLLAANGDFTKGIAINCGDSRVYWATNKYVETARVHTEVLNPRNGITFALGADRINKKIYYDTYFIDNPVEVFLCTDTFAYTFDGVHTPEEMFPVFGRAIGNLNDHLTAISLKRT